jgi:transposase
MQTIATIGLDIAKSVFQVHGVDAAGQVVVRRQLKRRHVLAFFQKLPPCPVGIEAYASSHYWSRELHGRRRSASIEPHLQYVEIDSVSGTCHRNMLR